MSTMDDEKTDPSVHGKAASSVPAYPPPPTDEWQTGLFECWEDCHLTSVGLFCPQCLHADTATRVDSFAMCCPYQCSYMLLHVLCLCALVGGQERAEIRRAFSLPEEPCSDCAVHTFCSLCALCQEAREVKRRSRASASSGLASSLNRRTTPPEVQHVARSYSHGLALEEWEWNEARGRVGAEPAARARARVNAPRAAPLKSLSLEQGLGRGSAAPREGEPGAAAGGLAEGRSPFGATITTPPPAQHIESARGEEASPGFEPAAAEEAAAGALPTPAEAAELLGVGETELEAMAGSWSMDMTAMAMQAADRIRRVDEQQHSVVEAHLNRISKRDSR